MAVKSLAFLALCLALAAIQGAAGANYNNRNNNNGYGNNGGSNGYNNNNNNNGGNNGFNNNGGYNDNNGGGNYGNNGGGGGGGNNGGNYGVGNSGSQSSSGGSGARHCKPLNINRKGLHVECSYNGDTASCTTNIVTGTQARMKCKKNFVEKEENQVPSMTCTHGVWSSNLNSFKCMEVPVAVGYNYTVGQGFYKYYNFKAARKWEDAKKVCENEGGHLIVIENAEQLDAANNTLVGVPISGSKHGGKGGKSKTGSSSSASSDVYAVYVGVSKLYTDDYVAVTTNASTPTNLCEVPTATTSKKIGKFCMALKPGPLCYVEVPCTAKRGFICEIEPTKDDSSSTTVSG